MKRRIRADVLDAAYQRGWKDGSVGDRPDPSRPESFCRYAQMAYDAGYSDGQKRFREVLSRKADT